MTIPDNPIDQSQTFRLENQDKTISIIPKKADAFVQASGIFGKQGAKKSRIGIQDGPDSIGVFALKANWFRNLTCRWKFFKVNVNGVDYWVNKNSARERLHAKDEDIESWKENGELFENRLRRMSKVASLFHSALERYEIIDDSIKIKDTIDKKEAIEGQLDKNDKDVKDSHQKLHQMVLNAAKIATMIDTHFKNFEIALTTGDYSEPTPEDAESLKLSELHKIIIIDENNPIGKGTSNTVSKVFDILTASYAAYTKPTDTFGKLALPVGTLADLKREIAILRRFPPSECRHLLLAYLLVPVLGGEWGEGDFFASIAQLSTAGDLSKHDCSQLPLKTQIDLSHQIIQGIQEMNRKDVYDLDRKEANIVVTEIGSNGPTEIKHIDFTSGCDMRAVRKQWDSMIDSSLQTTYRPLIDHFIPCSPITMNLTEYEVTFDIHKGWANTISKFLANKLPSPSIAKDEMSQAIIKSLALSPSQQKTLLEKTSNDWRNIKDLDISNLELSVKDAELITELKKFLNSSEEDYEKSKNIFQDFLKKQNIPQRIEQKLKSLQAFNLGCTLWKMFAGPNHTDDDPFPFPGYSDRMLVKEGTYQKVPNDQLNNDLQQLIENLCNPDPRKRPSLEEASKELNRIQNKDNKSINP